MIIEYTEYFTSEKHSTPKLVSSPSKGRSQTGLSTKNVSLLISIFNIHSVFAYKCFNLKYISVGPIFESFCFALYTHNIILSGCLYDDANTAIEKL